MRCLSIRQPFAWAVCVGLKTVENRVWKTKFRGTIAVHAATSVQYINSLRASTGMAAFAKDNFALGALIGTVDIVDVAPYGRQHETNPQATGPYCFTLANPKLFASPLPMKGKLNLFQLDDAAAEWIATSQVQSVDTSVDPLAKQVAHGLDFKNDVAECYHLLIEDLWDKEEVAAIQFAASRLVALEPNNAYGYFARYMFADLDRPLEQSLHDAQRMLEIEPDSAMAHACFGWTLHELNRNEEALQHLDKSLALSEEIPRAWYSRSSIHLALENFENAVLDSTRALQAEPNLVDALLVRSRASIALGNLVQAKQDAQEILAILPNDPEAREILELTDN